MRVLHVPYALWKSIAQANSFIVYEAPRGTDQVQTWAGGLDYIYSTNASGADHADYETAFPSPVVVASEDEAIGHIIGLQASIARDAFGALSVSISGGMSGVQGTLRWDDWGSTSLTKDAWVNAYTNTDAGAFVDATWETDSKDMRVRVVVDGVTRVDQSLKDLQDSYKLKQKTASPVCGFRMFENNRWRFKPSEPIGYATSIAIDFYATKPNKDIHRGMTERKEAT